MGMGRVFPDALGTFGRLLGVPSSLVFRTAPNGGRYQAVQDGLSIKPGAMT
jgi:hypothetical protein